MKGPLHLGTGVRTGTGWLPSAMAGRAIGSKMAALTNFTVPKHAAGVPGSVAVCHPRLLHLEAAGEGAAKGRGGGSHATSSVTPPVTPSGLGSLRRLRTAADSTTHQLPDLRGHQVRSLRL